MIKSGGQGGLNTKITDPKYLCTILPNLSYIVVFPSS